MQKLIIFSGLPGTGKSTVANRLARELGLPLLCIDDVIGEVPGSVPLSPAVRRRGQAVRSDCLDWLARSAVRRMMSV